MAGMAREFPDGRPRCAWVGAARPLDIAYHDEEWGVPVRDDRVMFEFLVLESAQAGLSWYTVLQRRAAYRRAFADFDARRVAAFTPLDVERLLADPAIIRHRGKIESAIHNAARFLEVQEARGSFASYAWSFVDGEVVQGGRESQALVPASSRQSDAFARDLKRRGFRFLGSTTLYAWMQAMGLVNDHLRTCFCHAPLCGRG